jgi:MoxR-like ATPase
MVNTCKPAQDQPLQTVFECVAGQVVGREKEIKAILAAMGAGKHILLEGPPGTSKSTLLRTIAHEAGVPFYIIEGNIDLTPAKLVGHFNPAKVMADSYLPEHFEKGPLTLSMENGGILYIEEFNRMPADVANVLISPMEEAEMTIPRYGTVKAVRPFTVIAAQNPYDDVGTVRVSRAFMDRICRAKMVYQDEDEEERIVRMRTGVEDSDLLRLAVRLVRLTREHNDIKLGASIRGAIDLIDLFVAMEPMGGSAGPNFLLAAQMAVANKIWLTEMTDETAESIIENILNSLEGRYRVLGAGAGEIPEVPTADKSTEEEPAGKKKALRSNNVS